MICPNCGNQTSEGAIFCDQCGTKLPVEEKAASPSAPADGTVICPACGAGNVPGEAFCEYCGSPLEAPTPAAAEEPASVPVAETEAESAPPAEELSSEPTVAGEPSAPAPEESTVLTCPTCGAEVLPGEAFCANCGASLAEPPLPPEPVAEEEVMPAPAPPAEEESPAPEPEEETPPAALTCPACGAEVEEGDAFCSACGFSLKGAAPAAPVAPPSSAGPRLIVAASGAEIPLPEADEILIGREDPISGIYPDVDLTPHGGEEGGVSRRHARLIVEGGNYFIEDLDSTNFTFINKQKIAPKTRTPVQDGDEIRCGRVALILKVT